MFLRNLLLLCLFKTLLGFTFSLSAQVSHSSGYYSDIDSLFFEVLWVVGEEEELQYSVNKFSEADFQKYLGGIWLKERSFTENTWENVHLNQSSGSVKITFKGTGLNAVSVKGKNTSADKFLIRLVVRENSPEGDIFDAYEVTNNELRIIEKGIQPQTMYSGNPYVVDSGDGWQVQWDTGIGYKIGDYWDIEGEPEANNSLYPSDYHQKRGDLRKVNTVRVRTVDNRGRVNRDSVYIIGFGEIPHQHHIFFVTADLYDVSDVLRTPQFQKLDRSAFLHIMNPDGVIEFSGKVDWRKAAGSSSALPNHGVLFKTKKENNKYILSNIYGADSEKIDRIKIRVGGTGQFDSFSGHEIALNVLNYPSLKLLGGVRNSVATWYLNGSYWSFGFPQEKPGKRFYKKILGERKSEIEIMRPMSFIFGLDTLYKGIKNGEEGVYFDISEETAKFLQLPVDTILFLPNTMANEDAMIILKDSIEERFYLYGQLKKGKGEKLKSNLSKLLLNESPIDSLLNIDLWSSYISLIHFGNLVDVINNNNDLGITSKQLLFPIMLDFDGFGNASWEESNWERIFSTENSVYSKNIIRIILSSFKKSQFAMDRLGLVYQDLLNTALHPDRTLPIIENLKKEVLPNYQEYHLAWGGGPNGGITLDEQIIKFQQFEMFYLHRPDYAYQFLTDYITPERNYKLEDRNIVEVIFDSIPKGIVDLKMNSLELIENYSGLYFPLPRLQIKYKVKDDYKVHIKEFPVFGQEFSIKADQKITLTFVLDKDYQNTSE